MIIAVLIIYQKRSIACSQYLAVNFSIQEHRTIETTTHSLPLEQAVTFVYQVVESILAI